MDSVLGGYPAILRAWLDAPELADPGVDCARCTHAPWTAGPSGPDDPACCNFHPWLANFLAGAALERGGIGAGRVRRRLARGSGVGALGVSVGDWWDEARTTCPYWVPGALSCSIWKDRGATCRTYFCVGGREVAGAWWDLSRSLARAEHHLAHRCALDGQPPVGEADSGAWEAWYRWCACHVGELEAERPDLDVGPAQPGLTGNRRVAALPDVVVPSAPPFVVQGDRVVFRVAAGWAQADYPRAVFAVLAACDGKRPWRDALRGTGLGPDVIEDLFRAGIVGPA